MSLPTRKIGNDDVSAIGFGVMPLSTVLYDRSVEVDDEERFRILDAALQIGCTNWDSSDVYGDNEDLLGKWFKRTGKRDMIFLATKFGANPGGSPDSSPEYMKVAIEKSLRRLGVERIDLYYLHRADRNIPIETTVRAMAELVKQSPVPGPLRSERGYAQARTCRASHRGPPDRILAFFLDIEGPKVGLLNACRELGIAVIAYSPLGRGMLTGTYKSPDDLPADDVRRLIPKFSKENFPNILKLVDGLAEVGRRYNATAGQIALAWLLAQAPEIIPIPGTRKIKYLRENAEASKIVLSDEDIRTVRKVADECNALSVGDRYPAHGMDLLLTDTIPLSD